MRKILLAILAVGALAGCASVDNDTLKRQADAQVALGNARVAEAQAAAEDSKATQALAAHASAQGADNALLMRSLKGLGIGQSQPAQIVQQQPQSVWGAAWNALLAVTDVGLRAYGIHVGGDVAKTQSNNARDVSLSTNQAFLGMGQQIQVGSTAGYQYVQAPGAVTNITNTLSGTGVLGNGTYTGPVNRNCSGGTAAAGGTGGSGALGTPGGTAGTGGAATGGNC